MQSPISLLSLATVCSLLHACAGPSADSRLLSASPNEAASTGWMHHTWIARNIAYGESVEQTLDLYLHGAWTGEPDFFERTPTPLPTLLYIHGGGWMVRDKSPEAWVLPFVEHGWHVVSMTYRVGPGTAPSAVHDAVCALDWVVDNANKYGFDTERIVVTGPSAGGHLSLTTGVLGSQPGHDCYPGDGFRVHAVVNWFGITDIAAVSRFLDANPPSFGNYAKAWVGDESRLADISAAHSPVHLVNADSPPVLTIHGTDDVIVPFDQAVVLHEKLRELGIRNKLLSLEGGTHAGFTDAQFVEAFETMRTFIEAR